ncbi:MAG: hypothetical protein ACP5I3_01260 [Thermoproteus sp.]
MKLYLALIAIAVGVYASAVNGTNATAPVGVLDNINNIINNWLNLGTNFLVNLEYTLKYYIVKISEVAAVIMAMIGAFLYFTRLSKYTGRSLLIGAVLLYLFAEILKGI